jgi:hypothetical protein
MKQRWSILLVPLAVLVLLLNLVSVAALSNTTVFVTEDVTIYSQPPKSTDFNSTELFLSPSQ